MLPFILGSCVAAFACSGAPEPADAGATYSTVAPALQLPGVEDELPDHLSDLGLYPNAPDLKVVARGAFGYEPRYPLWSNGSQKQRFVAVPEEADRAPEPLPAKFPRGTMLFKTFSFRTDKDSPLLPVETRVMRLGEDGWEYYRYLWDEAGVDAELLTTRTAQQVSMFADGEEFQHEVPGILDCKTCHEAGDSPVLGYRSIQLEDTPLSEDRDALTEEVLGYALGNCVHCHNGTDTEAGILDLRPESFMGSTVGVSTEGSGSSLALRVSAGEPDESALFLALSRGSPEDDTKPMPPLGVQLRDDDAVELFRAWIEGL